MNLLIANPVNYVRRIVNREVYGKRFTKVNDFNTTVYEKIGHSAIIVLKLFRFVSIYLPNLLTFSQLIL